jgi:hypothetical protein
MLRSGDACLAWLVSGVAPFRFRFHLLVRFLLCVVVVAQSWCVLCVVVVAPSWKRRCYVLLLFVIFSFFFWFRFIGSGAVFRRLCGGGVAPAKIWWW